MELIKLLTTKILEMFALLLLGYGLSRRHILSDEGRAELGRLLTAVVIPTVLLNSLWDEKTAERTSSLAASAVLSAAAMLISVALALLFFHKNGISCFSAAFSNAGFIGIPLVSGLLGSHSVFYISAMIVLIGILQFTAGLWMITGDRKMLRFRALAKNPVLLAVAVGLMLYMLSLPKPALLSSLFGSIGGLNTPLAMIVLGGYLAQTKPAAMLRRPSNYALSAVRLLVIPCVVACMFALLPMGNFDLKLSVLIACACPAATLGAIFARQVGGDFQRATEEVCVSTVFSLFSLPAAVAFFSILLR